MSLQLYFTKSNKIGSKIIRWVTGEPCSHVAIQINDYFVAHMTLGGFRIEHIEQFSEHLTIVSRIALDYPHEILMQQLGAYRSPGYDFKAILWLGCALLMRRLTGYRFNIKRNPWQDPHRFDCTEFATWLLDKRSDSVITPWGLYIKLHGH